MFGWGSFLGVVATTLISKIFIGTNDRYRRITVKRPSEKVEGSWESETARLIVMNRNHLRGTDEDTIKIMRMRKRRWFETWKRRRTERTLNTTHSPQQFRFGDFGEFVDISLALGNWESGWRALG